MEIIHSNTAKTLTCLLVNQAAFLVVFELWWGVVTVASIHRASLVILMGTAAGF